MIPKLATASDVEQTWILGKEEFLTKAQAAEIIRIVEAHEGLVKALEFAKDYLMGCNLPNHPTDGDFVEDCPVCLIKQVLGGKEMTKEEYCPCCGDCEKRHSNCVCAERNDCSVCRDIAKQKQLSASHFAFVSGMARRKSEQINHRKKVKSKKVKDGRPNRSN